jgi:hypothetical protein
MALEKKCKKTPSARVIAARWVLWRLSVDAQDAMLTSAGLSALAKSRVNDKKL